MTFGDDRPVAVKYDRAVILSHNLIKIYGFLMFGCNWTVNGFVTWFGSMRAG